MVRYMLYMSYIGSRYRGAQRQCPPDRVLDVDSIQGALEAGFLSLVPHSLVRPTLSLSSRTDAGVHALCSTGHIDLVNKYDTIYDSGSVLKWMNRYLNHCGHEIRLTSFFPIEDTFHARFSAKSRTYMYRIASPKYEDEFKLPIADQGHLWNVGDPHFDIEKVKKATRLFMGQKNFMTFSGKNRASHEPRYVRSLDELRIEEGQPFMHIDPLTANYNYWNILCSSRSFLYNQVRRMVAALVAVGTGDLTEKDINVMLHVPSPNSWLSRILVAPPCGLFLKEVKYDPEELASSRIRQ